MHVHHLNCACMRPFGGALYDGFSRGLTARLACHCLLIETESGLVLVDTGIGTEDIRNPRRLSAFFRNLNRIQLKEENTAAWQIRKLGYDTRDVRHIVMTHLDFDHAGGLSDFPQATVHVMRDEMAAAKARDGFIGWRRYRPMQWTLVRRWEFYEEKGDRWRGFGSVRSLRGLPPGILMIPLAGHTPGHAGIAVETNDGWLLDAGDAYFYRGEMDKKRYRCTPGLRFYQWMMETDRPQRLRNQQRLRGLLRDHDDVTVFCSHDQAEFDRAPPARAGHETALERISAEEAEWQKEIRPRHQIEEGEFIPDPAAAPLGTDQEAGGAISTPQGSRRHHSFLHGDRRNGKAP